MRGETVKRRGQFELCVVGRLRGELFQLCVVEQLSGEVSLKCVWWDS